VVSDYVGLIASRYFNNASVRDDHYKTKKHKKRCVYASAPVLVFFIMGGKLGIDVQVFELQALDCVVRTSILTLLFLVTAVVIHVNIAFP
jgi:hypothetical protein